MTTKYELRIKNQNPTKDNVWRFIGVFDHLEDAWHEARKRTLYREDVQVTEASAPHTDESYLLEIQGLDGWQPASEPNTFARESDADAAANIRASVVPYVYRVRAIRATYHTDESYNLAQALADLEACRVSNQRLVQERDRERSMKLSTESECAHLHARIANLQATIDVLSTDSRAVVEALLEHAPDFAHVGETAAPAIERMAKWIASVEKERDDRPAITPEDAAGYLLTRHPAMVRRVEQALAELVNRSRE